MVYKNGRISCEVPTRLDRITYLNAVIIPHLLIKSASVPPTVNTLRFGYEKKPSNIL
jgi:hypothetical protein